MINNSFEQEIKAVFLRNGFFTLNDFIFEYQAIINLSGKQVGTKVIITYKFVDKYYFRADIENGNDSRTITITFKPGDMEISEQIKVTTKEKVLASVDDWLLHLEYDLLATPEARMIKENEGKIKEIEEILEGFYQDKDRDFTQSERDELAQRLDVLECSQPSSMTLYTSS